VIAMKNKKGQPKASPNKKSRLNNTTSFAQRKRLLEAMQRLGAVNTMYARDRLNIMMPATRIHELRKLGHVIHTNFIAIKNKQGFIHYRIARYVLIKLAGDSNE
jgi:hypothetical protein